MIDRCTEIIETWGENFSRNVITNSDGQIVCIKYYKDEKLHRDGAPAVIFFCPDFGAGMKEVWAKDGMFLFSSDWLSSKED